MRARRRSASTPEQARALERYHLDFVRAGAGLAAEAKARLAAIGERLATLGAAVRAERARRREGLRRCCSTSRRSRRPAGEFRRRRGAARRAERGYPGSYAVTLSRSSHRAVPAILRPARPARDRLPRLGRARRRTAARHDNRARSSRETVRCAPSARSCSALRATPTSASPTRWPRRPSAALDLLESVWAPGARAGAREAEALQEMIAAEGGNFQLAAWDWRYYAEKRRKALSISTRAR